MAANSDGTTQLVTTIVTCEGDLNDPQFNQQFDKIVKDLNKLLFQGKFKIVLLKNVYYFIKLNIFVFLLFLFLLGTIQAPVDYFKKPIACNVD